MKKSELKAIIKECLVEESNSNANRACYLLEKMMPNNAFEGYKIIEKLSEGVWELIAHYETEDEVADYAGSGVGTSVLDMEDDDPEFFEVIESWELAAKHANEIAAANAYFNSTEGKIIYNAYHRLMKK